MTADAQTRAEYVYLIGLILFIFIVVFMSRDFVTSCRTTQVYIKSL